MSLADYIIIAILAVACVTGAISGAIKQLGTVAGFIIALLATRVFGPAVVDALVDDSSAHAYLYAAVVYVLLFVLVFFAVFLVARLLRGTAKKVGLGAFDRVAGALVRTVIWALVISACLNLYFAVCPGDRGSFISDKPARAWLLRLAPATVDFIGDKTS